MKAIDHARPCLVETDRRHQGPGEALGARKEREFDLYVREGRWAASVFWAHHVSSEEELVSGSDRERGSDSETESS